MAVVLASRARALWLVCLLAFTPAGPLGLTLSGHAPGQDTHAATLVHDPSDHGISAGALADVSPDRHCLYCQSTSSLRFGWASPGTHLRAPSSVPVDWPDTAGDRLRTRLRHALPARAPPLAA
jgi:hypothetical protein